MVKIKGHCPEPETKYFFHHDKGVKTSDINETKVVIGNRRKKSLIKKSENKRKIDVGKKYKIQIIIENEKIDWSDNNG